MHSASSAFASATKDSKDSATLPKPLVIDLQPMTWTATLTVHRCPAGTKRRGALPIGSPDRVRKERGFTCGIS